MDLSNDDLEDCMDKFRNTFLNHKNNKRDEEDLLLLMDRLAEDLKCSTQNEKVTRECLLRLSKSKEHNITEKYVTLDGKYRELEAEKKKEEDQRREYEHKMEVKIENLNLEITALKKQMENDRICFEVKENGFQNELQAIQAAADLKCDDIESNLQRQLVDANSKLRQAQNTIRTLQLENNDLRTQLMQQKYSNTNRNNILYFQESPVQTNRNNFPSFSSSFVTEPQHGFSNDNERPPSAYSASSRMTEEVSRPLETQKHAPEVPSQYTQQGYRPTPKNKTQTTKTSGSEKYPPLPIDVPSSENEAVKENVAQKIGKSQKTARYSETKAKNNTRAGLPSLMPCSNALQGVGRKSSEDNQTRKRKLYNPDDLNYLLSLIEPDD